MTKNAAVRTARKRASVRGDQTATFTTGVRVRIKPISVSIINDAQAAIPNPPVPMWYNESKGVEEPNPNHPDYLKALEETDIKRTLAAIDAMILFGIELLDGVPEDSAWLRELKLAIRLGFIDLKLDEWDLEDPLELEFLYKKYIAVSAVDLPVVMRVSGVREEDIAAAAESFRNNQERGSD